MLGESSVLKSRPKEIKFNKVGRTNAISSVDAIFKPIVPEKISIKNPKTNAEISNNHFGVLNGSMSIAKI